MKSAYIHIPFCKKICTYCDFCKQYYNEELINKYLKSLKQEILKSYKNESLKTLYIGGGTPSCLNKKELKELFEIMSLIKLDKEYEFTFECNIEDISEGLLLFLNENKVNRLSIGIESFNKKVLNVLGRNYNFNIKEKINLAKKYFENINIDLIYGINNETLKDLKKDLNEFLSLNIPHISIYSLILEEHTILKVNGYEEINEDLNREMYDYICKELKDNDYIHYEISNFSKKGYESKHNLTYWENDKYYGFGLGASGYVENVRYTNTRSLNDYIKGNFIKEKEIMTKKIDMENFMILGLRKLKGVSEKEFYKRYNVHIKEVFKTNKLNKKDNYYYIDEENIYISNSILEDFINI